MIPHLIIIILLVIIIVCMIYFYSKKSSEALQHLKTLQAIENIVAQTNDALFVIEIVNGKVLHVNNATAKLLGFSTGELLSKTYFDFLPKELVHKSAEIIADVWENKGMVFSDIPYLHKNGEVIHVECSAKIGSFDDQAAIVIYARDIRERLKYEKEIREINTELTQKNKDILDSIRYAKRIQESLMPTEKYIERILKNK
jgi:PAS domain S-box-containing protein